MIVVGGILQENPFFVPPDQFLRELREREGMDQGGRHQSSRDRSGRGPRAR
jgi:hypothetical protein